MSYPMMSKRTSRALGLVPPSRESLFALIAAAIVVVFVVAPIDAVSRLFRAAR